MQLKAPAPINPPRARPHDLACIYSDFLLFSRRKTRRGKPWNLIKNTTKLRHALVADRKVPCLYHEVISKFERVLFTRQAQVTTFVVVARFP